MEPTKTWRPLLIYTRNGLVQGNPSDANSMGERPSAAAARRLPVTVGKPPTSVAASRNSVVSSVVCSEFAERRSGRPVSRDPDVQKPHGGVERAARKRSSRLQIGAAGSLPGRPVIELRARPAASSLEIVNGLPCRLERAGSGSALSTIADVASSRLLRFARITAFGKQPAKVERQVRAGFDKAAPPTRRGGTLRHGSRTRRRRSPFHRQLDGQIARPGRPPPQYGHFRAWMSEPLAP